VISLDFELHWGVRDRWPVAEYRENLLGVWEVVPRTLELFARHEVRATWATVGFLMAEDRDELLAHLPERRPAYADPGLDPYAALGELGHDERDDPYHYAPSLVARVAETPGQEIGTHTFSHYYALEPAISDAAFGADLDAALALAARRGLTLTSIVFPRNQVAPGALRVCRERGLTAFRGTERAWHRRPRTGATAPAAARALNLLDSYVPVGTHHLARAAVVDGMVDVPGTRYLRPWSASRSALEPVRLQRIRTAMTKAARTGQIFHLWWHPHDFGARPDENLAALEQVLGHFARLRAEHGFVSASMRDVAEETLASGSSRTAPAPMP
jgi:peptidoglycan/xylan/chitin deacetylase (PgdA/CDA1 family)